MKFKKLKETIFHNKMAYGRRRKRTYGRKRKMFKKGGISRMVARKVYTALDRNIETKFVDTFFDSGVTGIVGGTYVFTKLTTTSLGLADNNNRIGDRIKLKSLQVKFNSVAADTVNRVRVTIIRWNEDDTFSPPTTGQIYQNGVASIQSFFNFDSLTAKKFSILYDKVLELESANNSQLMVKRYIPLKGSRVNYTSGGSTGTGNLFFIYSSDSALSPHPSIDVYARVTYKDA